MAVVLAARAGDRLDPVGGGALLLAVEEPPNRVTPSLALATVLAVAAVLLSLWVLGCVAARPRPAARSPSGRGSSRASAPSPRGSRRARPASASSSSWPTTSSSAPTPRGVSPTRTPPPRRRSAARGEAARAGVPRGGAPGLPRARPALLRGPAPAGDPEHLLRVSHAGPRGRGPVGGPARAARQRGRPLRRPAGGRAQHHRAQARAAGDRARARAAAADRHPRAGGHGHARPRGPPPRAQHALAALPAAPPTPRWWAARSTRPGRGCRRSTGGCSSGPSPARW